MLIDRIKEETPKAFQYFTSFVHDNYGDIEKVTPFESLPFAYQLGVYVLFFDEINSDIQLYATAEDALKESVLDAFTTYEEYLFLDS